MDNIKIYEVNPSYINYLAAFAPHLFHNKKQGQQNTRKYIGVVLYINGFSYFAPLSSFKEKHKTMKEGIDFLKIKNYAVINLNNMFPVPNNECTYVFYIYDALKKSQRERIEKMELEQQNLLYESQMKLQKESEEKVRILRHDMKNHFYQMKSLLRLKKLDELEEYMNHIIQTTESTGDFCKSGNADVDGIVNLKLSKAKEMGAELHFDFKIPEKLNIETFDMNCILGNLLDNVLDAFENVERRIVYLQMTYQKGVLNFCLRNSFNGQLKVNEKNQLLSIKQGDAKHHGFGVKSIIETVERYDGEFEYECEGNVFSVYIMMYER